MPKRTLIGLAALCAASATACGDGPICPSEVVVVLSSLDDGATITASHDVSEDDPGLQIDIDVRSNLRSGDELELTVTDSEGAVSQFLATADGEGNATFEGVNLPAGAVTLDVVGTSGKKDCGSGSDSIEITVVPEAACDLTIAEGPIENDFYDPIPVLNTTNDSDAAAGDFQANVQVATAPGFNVELFVLDVASGAEESQGAEIATAEGLAEFAVTLPQGTQALRATCVSESGGASAASATNTVFVDTVAPESCSLDQPAPGSSVTPDDDEDPDTGGVQLTLQGSASASDGDIEGETPTFTVGATMEEGTPLSAGASTAAAVFGSPGTVPVSFTARDHAQNPCVDEGTVTVELEGCAITHEVPAMGSTVTADSDGATPGFQTDIEVQIDSECEGLTATTTCGQGGSATVPADGRTTIPVTLSSEDQAQGSADCQTEVTHPSGFTTFAEASFDFDNLGPATFLEFKNPVLACGDVISNADDVDGDSTNGVQIEVRVTSPSATEREVELTNSGGTQVLNAPSGSNLTITLADGTNNVVGIARDDHGNETRTQDPCEISLEDIAVGFSPPIDDGLVGISDDDDGDVSGGVTLDLCGTVSEPTASVEVSIDGGAAQAANVPGDGTWCLANQTLSESTHTIDVTATSGGSVGTNSLSLVVDLSPPGAPSGFTAQVLTRHSVGLTWTAPDDGGSAADSYIGKVALVPLTDANFDSTGTVLEMPVPGAPSTLDGTTVEQLFAGTEYHFGVAAVDEAGNRSAPATGGPFIPAFDFTPRIDPPTAGDTDGKRFGYRVVRGDFNGDGFGDLAVSDPNDDIGGNTAGSVHVYFGSGSGIAAPPDVTIEGPAEDGQFGFGLTRMRYNGDAVDDLVVGAPFADNFNGEVYVFFGGASFAPATAADRDALITAGGGWFAFSAIGSSLATTDFDGDSEEDLVIGAPFGGGQGGAAVLYDGGETSIALNDVDTTGMGNALAHIFPNQENDGGLFGIEVFNLGRTQGSADTRGDIAISYFADDAPDPDHVYVVRGRADKPQTNAVEFLTFGGNDLSVEDDLGPTCSSTATSCTGYGASVASLPDLNSDGARDIAIASPHDRSVTIVSGGATGAQTLSNIAISTISGTGLRRAVVVNNADAAGAGDIDTDGLGDLVILGGAGTDSVNMYIWFHPNIPTANTDSSSADHVIPAPSAFRNVFSEGQKIALEGIFAGDVNNDGLEDICWADYRTNPDGNTDGNGLPIRDGSMQVLWDDPIN